MEVPTLSQVETRRAFQAAHDLHQILLPHNNQLNMQDQSTSPLVSQTEPCPDPTYRLQIPRKSVEFQDNLQIRFLISSQDGETIFQKNQIMKDRQTYLTSNNNLMGLDVSRKEVFYQTHWSSPTSSNEEFDNE